MVFLKLKCLLQNCHKMPYVVVKPNVGFCAVLHSGGSVGINIFIGACGYGEV